MPVIGVRNANVNARLMFTAALTLGIDLRRMGDADESAQFLPEAPEGISPDLVMIDAPISATVDGLVVLLAKSPHQQVSVYPVTLVDGNQIIAPAPITADLASRLQRRALELTDNAIGMCAVTFDRHSLEPIDFSTGPNLAGVWTIDGALTSQYEQHLRALFDLPLGAPDLLTTLVMSEIVIGGEKPELFRPFLHLFARDPQLRIHLYGKEVYPGTTIGHVTVLGEDIHELQLRVRHAAGYLNGEIDE